MVREPEIHQEVLEKVIHFAGNAGFGILGLDFSPIKGPEGNIEYLLHLQKGGAGGTVDDNQIAQVVSASHEQLG